MARQLIAFAFAIIVGWLTWTGISTADASQLGKINSALITVSVTLMGFSMTVLAVIAAAGDRRLTRNIAKTGHLESMYKMLFVSIAAYMIALVSGIVLLFVHDGAYTGYLVVANAALLAWATAFLTYAGNDFYKLVIALARSKG